jgi:hypothetical protein
VASDALRAAESDALSPLAPNPPRIEKVYTVSEADLAPKYGRWVPI